MKNLLIAFSLLTALLIGIGCSKEYSLENAAIVPAVGTLKDDTGQCPLITVLGPYIADSTMTDSNRIQFLINVQSPGTYRIQTNQVNGIRFVDSGYFATKGKRLITLKAYGKAIADTVVSYDITWDTSVCSFSIDFEPKGGVRPPNIYNDNDSAWAFTEGGVRYHGPFDATVTYIQSPTTPGLTAFTAIGSSYATGDSALTLIIGNLTGAPLAVKTYNSKNQQEGSKFTFTDLRLVTSPVEIFNADPNLQTYSLDVVVTAWDPTTKIIEGTFSGTVRGPATSTRTITDGKFKAQAQ